jgi:hypothetical protein
MVTNGCNGDGAGPWLIERAVRQAKVAIAESENDFEDKVLTLPDTRSAIGSVNAERVDSVQATAAGLRTDAAPRRNRRR